MLFHNLEAGILRKDCVSVDTQWCSATDGRTRQHRVMDDSLLPFTSLRENLTQAHLDFSYFRTTEPKLTPALRKMPAVRLWTPFGWAVHLKTGGVGANFWYSHYAYNLLMILMYCIIDIQPDDLSEVSSAMSHYINHFVNYQTNNADY